MIRDALSSIVVHEFDFPEPSARAGETSTDDVTSAGLESYIE